MFLQYGILIKSGIIGGMSMSGSKNAIAYRCAFVLNQQAVIWDNKVYFRPANAYNRLETLKEQNDYFGKYGSGEWEVMYAIGWKRDNDKRTLNISTVKWVEADE